MTPEQRWANRDPHATMAHARQAQDQKYAQEIDPDGTMDPERRAFLVQERHRERCRRAGQASAARRRST